MLRIPVECRQTIVDSENRPLACFNISETQKQSRCDGTLESLLGVKKKGWLIQRFTADSESHIGWTPEAERVEIHVSSSRSLRVLPSPARSCSSNCCVLISFTLLRTPFRRSSPSSRASYRAWLRFDTADLCLCSNRLGSKKTPGITPAARVYNQKDKHQTVTNK